MKTISRIFLLVLCAALLTGLASCEGSVTADIVLSTDQSMIWAGSKTVLNVFIPVSAEAESGAAFSPEISLSDLTIPAELAGADISVTYVNDTMVRLTVSGEFPEEGDAKITFSNSAFAKNKLTGFLFAKIQKAYLSMNQFSSRTTEDGQIISFSLNVSGTTVDQLDYAVEGLADGEAEDASKVSVTADGNTIKVKLEGVHPADEEKPIVIVLKEGSFALRREIRVEVPESAILGVSGFIYF